VLGLLAVLVAGCDLFKPATPELGGGGSTLLPNYSEPESCLRYMQEGVRLKEKSGGREAYLGALADTTKDGRGFHAFFDQAVWNAYAATRPADWDLALESDFLSRFFQSFGDEYEMRWLPDESFPHDDDFGDSRILHRRYEVWALRPSTTDLLFTVGYADLYFSRISPSRWALTRWQDRVAPEAGFPPTDPDQQCFGHRRLNAGAGG